jgi:RimJ/RimL family protein N-acetyltransferase
MKEIPVLETPRLILRPHRLEDLPSCVAMWADSEITRYTIGTPSTEQRTWMRMLAYLGHWAVLGFGYWAIEERSTRRYIGELGFADFKRDLKPSIDGIPELGWALALHAHGKGYATEGLSAAVAWGDSHFKSKKTVCIIAPDNVASLRVAEKCGYKEIARTEKNGAPEILFERMGV